MTKSEIYFKLVTVNIISFYIAKYRNNLRQELYEQATDTLILKRRFRMLSQLADYESQILKKIYNFQGGDINDYVVAVYQIFTDLHYVTNRSG